MPVRLHRCLEPMHLAALTEAPKGIVEEMVGRETEAPQWLDNHFLARHEEQTREMENECCAKDLCVEELEAQVERMKGSLEDYERELAEKYSSKLENRLRQFRMTPAGRVPHFSLVCPHFARAQLVRQCHVRLAEGGLTETERDLGVTANQAHEHAS